MTILRNAAKRLADFTTRHASPGTRVWAEALANELDAIQSDWRAFAWALGGTRVLVHRRPKPIYDFAELGTLVEKYASRRRHSMNNPWLARNVGWIGLIVSVLPSMPLSLAEHRPIGRFCIYLAGMLWMALAAYLISREPKVPDRDDLPGMIRFYRYDLARNTRIHLFAFLPACLLLACAGYQVPAIPWLCRLMQMLWMGCVILGVDRYRKNRNLLAQIDAFLATGQDH